VKDELNAIELACVDQLKTLKDEKDVLDGRIKAMDDMKSSVAEAVYLRVRSDYAAKRDALEAQSQPLREKAREQYAKLLGISRKLEAEQETIKLDREEIELRHKLGEFDKKEHEKRIKHIESAAAEKSEWHAKAQELRARFLAAVRGEDELAGQRAAQTQAVPAADAYITGEVQQPPRPAAIENTNRMPRVEAPAAPVQHESTVIMPAVRPGAAAPAPAPAATADATQMFRPSRLVPQNPEAGKSTYTLSLKMLMIGADSANDVRIGGPGVEPKHAQLAPTAQGYVLTDFDTKHGTRVNAEKIKERVLNNEDVVQIGAARFVFRVG
jgi:hypothetical protein